MLTFRFFFIVWKELSSKRIRADGTGRFFFGRVFVKHVVHRANPVRSAKDSTTAKPTVLDTTRGPSKWTVQNAELSELRKSSLSEGLIERRALHRISDSTLDSMMRFCKGQRLSTTTKIECGGCAVHIVPLSDEANATCHPRLHCCSHTQAQITAADYGDAKAPASIVRGSPDLFRQKCRSIRSELCLAG